MLIRRFRPDDADALASIFHAAVHGTAINDYTPEQVAAWSPAPPDARCYLRRAETRTVFVAEGSDGTPVAYGDMEADGHIDHLYCHPDVTGTGVGSALYEAVETAAREMGLSTVVVEASEGARRLFERRGFVLQARCDFRMGGVAMHNYRMSKRLE